MARSLAAPLGALMAQTAAISRFDFKSDFPVNTRVEEIHQLANAVGQMKDTIQRLLDVSIALSSERNFDALIERVLREVLMLLAAMAASFICMMKPAGYSSSSRSAGQKWGRHQDHAQTCQ
ncbi:MAG: HAMP domain-containing protein [Betaproteobacteria bacterium]|nr:HAMP domain-containing protein [Betaproteobacteria bacterium]